MVTIKSEQDEIVFGGDLPSDNYVANAIKYIKRKYKNPIFIAISDDVKRLKKILKKEKNISTPEVDMAILSFCNHSIFTLGTYGFWASYLAGGEVLYADM
ncbi:Galactoside 2-alpha-L-fucosyltransferase 1 [Armadillidium nasatum]|uniref:L-Fucosyltransferase n=1 Tax=Armadillidium nasatum TaxID=96803 RepID=A0A5N5T7E9_9CRUS|nr:Galactoside 2-alpha-L-fucosyltransferase 1 [Armadillidium nasatum]